MTSVRLVSMTVVVMLWTFPALAGDPPAVEGFHAAFNALPGAKTRLSRDECEFKSGLAVCRYSAAPATRIQVTGDRLSGPLDEVSAYFPPEKRSALDAVAYLASLMRTLSPSARPAERGKALDTLLNASASGNRAEAMLQGVRYVLRPNDGRDVRVYATVTER